MDKRMMLTIAMAVVSFVPAAYAGPPASPEGQQASQQPAEQLQQLEVDNKNLRILIDELKKKYTELSDSFDKVKVDRDNLAATATQLNQEKKDFVADKNAVESLTNEKNSLVAERDALKQQSTMLSTELDKFKTHFKNLAQDRTRLEETLKQTKESDLVIKVKEQANTKIRELNERTATLTKENTDLTNELKTLQKNMALMEKNKSKFQVETEDLQKQVTELQREGQKLKDENRYLAQEANEFPARFADLARQNKRLIEDAANMHYNTGVFYVNNKDYKRAILEFDKVLEIKPDHAYASYNLGYIYAEHLIDRPKAIKYFKSYLHYAPDAQDADWVRKYIITWQTWYGEEPLK